MSCNKRKGIEMRSLARSISMQEPDELTSEPPACTQPKYPTATSSLLGRWKKSFKRKMNGSPSASVIMGNGRVADEEAATIDISNLMSFDEPFDETSDDIDMYDAELSVRICRDGIRNNILDMMRMLGGDIKILEAIEDSRNSTCSLLETASNEERAVALLWASFLKRRDLFPVLVPGADLNFCTPDDGLTALHLSAFSSSADCVRVLLAAGAKITKPQALSPLHCAALGNSTECIKLLLEAGAPVNYPKDPSLCEQQDSPLHCAIKANAPECVNQLLYAGADATFIGQGGLTPLHVAADLGYTECLRVLLDSGKSVDVNAKTQDRRGHTALHLTAEEECASALQMLLDHGADATSRNLRGQTALHIAARVQSIECINILLPKSEINEGDADKRTPLHAAVGKAAGAAETAEILSKVSGVDINRADRYGHTALHIAALNELPTASAVLIRNGADLTARTKRGATALGLVIRKAPAALSAVEDLLDSSIRMSYASHRDRDVELKLDFRPLLQGSRKVEVSFLSTFIAEGHPEILQHPLCQAFLHLKWETIRKFYFARLILSFLFVCCLSMYVLFFLTNNCFPELKNLEVWRRDNSRNKSAEPKVRDECRTDSYLGGIQRKDPIYFHILQLVNILMLVLTGIEIVRKLYGLLAALSAPTAVSLRTAMKTYLCQIDNILEWFTLISVPLISNIVWGRQTYDWQPHLGAFAVLAGWANLMIMIGQLPLFGAYVAMYTCVLREFIKLLGAYICLLIGFAISFCVIFHRANEFSNPLIAMVKVLVMMTGELEFNDLLIEKDENKTGDQDPNKNGTPNSFSGDQNYLTISAHIIFVLCLLLVTVALMNLLVGIAVHDIHGLRASAGLSKLQRQADLVGYVETALIGCCSSRNHRSYIGQLFSTRLRCVHNTKHARSNSTIMHIKPHNSLDSRLPRNIVKAAYEVAKHAKRGIPKSRPGTLKRLNSNNSTETGLMYPVQLRQKEPSTNLAPRRRTMYLKNDEGVESQTSLDVETDTSAVLKQLSEDMAELRQTLAVNQAMLRKLLAANEHITQD